MYRPIAVCIDQDNEFFAVYIQLYSHICIDKCTVRPHCIESRYAPEATLRKQHLSDAKLQRTEKEVDA